MFEIIKVGNKYLIVCNAEREDKIIERSYRVISEFNTLYECEGFLFNMSELYKEVISKKNKSTNIIK